MDKKQFKVLVLVTALSGFVGGAVSERLFSAPQALAAKAAAAPGKVLVGSEFRLVDSKGEVQCRIGFDNDLPTVFWRYRGTVASIPQGTWQKVVIATLPGTQPPKPRPAQ